MGASLVRAVRPVAPRRRAAGRVRMRCFVRTRSSHPLPPTNVPAPKKLRLSLPQPFASAIMGGLCASRALSAPTKETCPRKHQQRVPPSVLLRLCTRRRGPPTPPRVVAVAAVRNTPVARCFGYTTDRVLASHNSSFGYLTRQPVLRPSLYAQAVPP